MKPTSPAEAPVAYSDLKEHEKNTVISPLIKGLAVGKTGSRDLSEEQVEQALAELQSGRVHPIQKAVFYCGLHIKGPTVIEKKLLSILPAETFESAERFIDYFAPGTLPSIRKLLVSLYNENKLEKDEATELAHFMFSHEGPDEARAMAAIILRMRYTTLEEYFALYQQMNAACNAGFQSPWPGGRPVLQLAEPFDGVNRSHLVTPLIAHHFASTYRVVSMVGRSSGPKFGNTLLDLVQELQKSKGLYHEARASESLAQQGGLAGWYISQANLSGALDRWVDLRKLLVKRPFLATLEKYVNPYQSDIFMASAFHEPYGDLMLELAQKAGFKGIVIIRKGREGSLAFSLKKPVEIRASYLADNGYEETQFQYSLADLGLESQPDARIDSNVHENARLVSNYLETGQSGDVTFDLRVKLTLKGLQRAIDFAQKGLNKKQGNR